MGHNFITQYMLFLIKTIFMRSYYILNALHVLPHLILSHTLTVAETHY